eukprot:NODE_576_length_6549_cov_0.390078.p2 type:complete len:348 gc:universal NODE_576_length_6549_cov_0.390078:3000-4043(+)
MFLLIFILVNTSYAMSIEINDLNPTNGISMRVPDQLDNLFANKEVSTSFVLDLFNKYVADGFPSKDDIAKLPLIDRFFIIAHLSSEYEIHPMPDKLIEFLYNLWCSLTKYIMSNKKNSSNLLDEFAKKWASNFPIPLKGAKGPLFQGYIFAETEGNRNSEPPKTNYKNDITNSDLWFFRSYLNVDDKQGSFSYAGIITNSQSKTAIAWLEEEQNGIFVRTKLALKGDCYADSDTLRKVNFQTKFEVLYYLIKASELGGILEDCLNLCENIWENIKSDSYSGTIVRHHLTTDLLPQMQNYFDVAYNPSKRFFSRLEISDSENNKAVMEYDRNKELMVVALKNKMLAFA